MQGKTRHWTCGLVIVVTLGGARAQDSLQPLALAPTLALHLSSASRPVSGPRDLRDKVRSGLLTALREHPDVLSARAMYEGKTYEVEAAKYARFPRFQVGSGLGTATESNGSDASFNVMSASARMTLIDGGVIGARIESATANTEAFDAALRSTTQKVALDALTAYMQVLRFESKRLVAENTVAVLDELARLERRRVDLGAVGESEWRMARARRSAFAAKAQEFQLQQVDALAKFEQYFRFRPEAAQLPALAIPSAWMPAGQEQMLQVATGNSTELLEARNLVEKARAFVRQQEAARFPAVDLVLSKTRDPRGTVYTGATRAGVELNWNIGSGFDLELRIKAAEAEVSNQEARLEAARLNLTQLATTAWGQAEAGRNKVAELEEAIKESSQLVQGRHKMLEYGRETLANVLDAQVELENQRLDLVDAMVDLRINELRVARVMGRFRLEDGAQAPWIEQILSRDAEPGMLLPAGLPSKGGCIPGVGAAPCATALNSGGGMPGLRLKSTWELGPLTRAKDAVAGDRTL